VKRLNQKRNLRKVVRALATVGGVRAVFLYGSFARGDFGPRSDLDLFIVTSKPGVREEVMAILAGLDLDRSIQPTIRSETELRQTDSGLLQNVFREGMVLYLREPMEIPVDSLLSLKPYSIFTFELARLDQKTKAKFNRELYERTKGKYEYNGLLGELGGEKLSRGSVIMPFDGRERLLRLLKKYDVEFDEVRVWR